MTRFFIALILLLSLALPGSAQISNDALEAQTREIGQSLRCVVCQNQSINDSDAPLASDMRNLIKQKLKEGNSQDEIIAYMRDKYGDYVLLKPPVQTNTLILWLGPFLLLALIFIWFARHVRNHASEVQDPTE